MSMTYGVRPADLDGLEPTIPGLIGDLRSDHAGETGAVMIYRGVLAGSRDPDARRVAIVHLATEEAHLALMSMLIPRVQQSVLLPLWRIAGWCTGFLPALCGANAVYATIDAVETFVVRHYAEQIAKLPQEGATAELRAVLVACQTDEGQHRDEARRLQSAPAGRVLRAWTWVVGLGSHAAVIAARRI